MVGGIRLAYCPCGTGSTPPIVEGPAFEGDAALTFNGSGTQSLNFAPLYATGTTSAPCYSYPVIYIVQESGVRCNLVSNVTAVSTVPYAITNSGSYNAGVSVKTYGCVAKFENVDQRDSDDYETTFVEGVRVDGMGDPWDAPCGTPPSVGFTTYISQLRTTDVYFSSSFSWLGVAQRDLPGIRLERLSGVTAKWLVTVDAGTVRVYREDGTDSYQTSGSLSAVAANINSALAGKIRARASGFSGYPSMGETTGDIAAGKNEWHYLFTKDDPSTMLKDLGPTYIQATFCNDPLAPFGWGNSTRLAVYRREELLPPRGVVFLQHGSGVGYLMNSLYADRPELKQYPNTKEGALSFIKETTYAKTQTLSWANYGDSISGWQQVLNQINSVTNQTKYSPGTRTYITNYATDFGWSETYTHQIYNNELFGTCPSPNPGCPPVNSFCQPDADCTYGPFNCIGSGCYHTVDAPFPLPCGILIEQCTAYYERLVPGELLTITPPTYIEYKDTTSFSIRIS
jgi:hypothetical protein